MFDPALLTAFAAGAALPPLFRLRAIRRFGLPVTVRVDPEDPQPQDVRGYLVEIAQRLDERPEKMRVTFHAANARRHRITLDLDDSGRLVVSVEGHRPAFADLRRRWIPDHPIPFTFAAGRRPSVLYVTPVDAGRFRVDDQAPFTVPLGVYIAISAAVTLGIVLARDVVIAAALGAFVGCLCVLRRRPATNPSPRGGDGKKPAGPPGTAPRGRP